jgi:RNA polymerase sigma-70 factor, ECF subfamily
MTSAGQGDEILDEIVSVDGRARDELELVDRLRAGDDQAFAQVLDAWSLSMRRLAASYVGSQASAEEVVQETWLAVIEHLDDFEGRSSFRHWVFRIVANTAKRRAARDRRTVLIGDLALDDESTVDPSRFRTLDQLFPGHWRHLPAPWPDPAQAAEQTEVRRVVAEALRQIPARQAAVVALRDIDGLDAGEVADLMGISAANQRVLLHRGRASVRAAIEAFFAGRVTDRRHQDSGQA